MSSPHADTVPFTAPARDGLANVAYLPRARAIERPAGTELAAGAWALPQGAPIAEARRIVRRLGGGAEHEVFLVDDAARGRCVAKLARPRLVAAGQACDALVREANALCRVADPGVVRCLDVVLRGPYPHLLLEYVAGPTLRGLLRAQRPPAPHVACELGASLALTLDAIATAGWVHLDVKPENIVLAGRPVLLDFGIAQRVAAAAELNAAIGTPAYMAPEQRACAGTRPHAPVGPAADVYALAVTLHELLTGRLPSLGRAVSPIAGVNRLLDAALDHDPHRRPSAAAFAAGLPVAGSRAA